MGHSDFFIQTYFFPVFANNVNEQKAVEGGCPLIFHNMRLRLRAYFLSKQPTEEKAEIQDDILPDLTANIIHIRTKFSNSTDLQIREITLCGFPVAMLACEAMVNSQVLSTMVVGPLKQMKLGPDAKPQDVMHYAESESILAMEQKQVHTYEELFRFVMSGFVIFLVDGVPYGMAMGVQGFGLRGISEPSSEVNERGSREGFIEAIRPNLAMVRRRIKSPTMVYEMMNIGSKSKTDICLVYLSDRVSKDLLYDVKKRLSQVKLEVVLESGYLQPFVDGKPLSLFSEVGTTERPDTLCAKINEGRIAILVDGTPFALIIPQLFVENFQNIDDYTHRPFYATFIRWLKYFAFFLSFLLPGLYVAVGTFHPELLPHALLLNITAAEETTPFPLMLEALIIHLIYEIMHEAGLRLPRPVGHAVSIVGALVIGDAAVTAGLIGSPMVMVVALTAISSFVVPNLYDAIVILRFAFILAGGLGGFYGIVLGMAFLLFNICSLRNYGVPYTAPVSPFTFSAMRDVLIRAGWKRMQTKDVKVEELNGVHIKKE